MKSQKPKNCKTNNWKMKNQKIVKRKTVGLDHHTLRSATQSHIIVPCITGRVVVKEWVTLCWYFLIVYGENDKFSKFTLVLWTNFQCYAPCALVWLTSRLRSRINVLSVIVLPLYMWVKAHIFTIFFCPT